MNRKPLRALAVLAAACPFVVLAASEPRESVLAADAAFAALSVERSSQQAFQAYLARDGIVFRPTAVTALEWLGTHEQASGRLEWRSSAAAVACDGRLALTSGPWVYSNAEGGEPVAGHYLSLWRREDDGGWVVVLDHGVEHALETPDAGVLQSGLDALWPPAAPRDCPPRTAPSLDGLADADRRLNEAIRSTGIDVAIRQFAHARALAYRDESRPRPLASDWPADGLVLGSRVDTLTQAAIAAPGSDMGYTYGEIVGKTNHDGMQTVRAAYVRVWLHDGLEWRVGLDMLTPVPETSEP